MATPGRQKKEFSISSTISTLKVYSVPILLFSASLFFQLVVLPRNYPLSHYDVLGIPKYSSIEEVTQAYEKITSQWNHGTEAPQNFDLTKVQYAFELLTNQLLKRDYDIYNIDEQFSAVDNVQKFPNETKISIIETASFDPEFHDHDFVKSDNFLSTFEEDKALLLQVISFGSPRCAEFSTNWKSIVNLLDGVANTGIVELGDVQLAAYLADKKSTGQPFFRNGVPAFLAFPPGCKSSSCLQRYEGDLSVDSITDWFASSVLGLPRILYYSKETMVSNFLVKSKPHKVKVIFISKTGERATPFIRQAAATYSPYANFAFGLWREEESSYWWNMFGVESAPAIVFLKDPGVEPVVYQGYINSSMFIDIMEKNKLHVLPQLRNITSMELGCDSQGYSRAGTDTKIWYCAIVAGRLSQELNKMRKTVIKVQETLINDGEIDTVDQDSRSTTAALALKQKRLTFAWLDGEAQQKYCFFHIHSETSYDSCGPRRDITDVAKLFLVRYERNEPKEEDEAETKKKTQNIFQSWQQTETDPVSTLVAMYNGTTDIPEITKWISETIKDGDTREIPPFKSKTPELLPEDGDSVFSKGSKKFVSSGKALKNLSITRISDYIGDPRIGPSLLLGALMSFGLIWLKRSQPNQSITNQHEANQTNVQGEAEPVRRTRRRNVSNQLIPPSITDMVPDDAQQMQFSDSD